MKSSLQCLHAESLHLKFRVKFKWAFTRTVRCWLKIWIYHENKLTFQEKGYKVVTLALRAIPNHPGGAPQCHTSASPPMCTVNNCDLIIILNGITNSTDKIHITIMNYTNNCPKSLKWWRTKNNIFETHLACNYENHIHYDHIWQSDHETSFQLTCWP